MRFAFLLFLMPATLFAQGKSTDSIYDRTLRSTVFVIAPMQDNSGRAATGSGSFIGSISKTNNPVIITNYHVVAPCVRENGNHGEVRVMFPMRNAKGEVEQNRTKYLQSSSDPVYTFRGKVHAYLKNKDLALVEVLLDAGKGQQLPKGVTMLPLAANSPKPSSRVHTIGNTGAGGMWSYTEGNVRSVYEKRFEARLSPTEKLQVDARLIESSNPTNQGDSGGPLVNDDSELVGVTQGGVTNANQLSTFIDIQEVRALLRQQKVLLPTRRTSTVAQGLQEKQDKVEMNRDVASNIPAKKDAEKPASDPRETAAEGKLRNAKRAYKVKDYELAENFLKQIITDYGETKAVVEAKSLLEDIKKSKK